MEELDENGMLWGIRGLVKQIRDADKMGGRLGAGMKRDRAMELADAVAELDAHLSDNGMLPLAWRASGATGKAGLPPEAVEGGTAGTGQKLEGE